MDAVGKAGPARPEVLDGPSDVTVYARSSTPETEITATLNIVSPDGTVTKQADGVLLGSQRQLDPETSWYAAGHTPLQPESVLTSTPQELTSLSGGVYSIERSPLAASFGNVPLTSPNEFTTSPVNWGPSS